MAYSLALSQPVSHGLEVHWFLDNLEILWKLSAVHWLQEGPAAAVALQLSHNDMADLHVLPEAKQMVTLYGGYWQTTPITCGFSCVRCDWWRVRMWRRVEPVSGHLYVGM